ncbi:hypothetical protein BDN70DRAFT_937902 [Pholiota conissans]|uniref:Uncharacterized protein n=1 Tax=Pholiota conissans TaxID=109636 RepID=A0A9P5YSE1_9AGAR|nr:hypothetical protein BDN70DRAFT_937902 [Pholiota conissans]
MVNPGAFRGARKEFLMQEKAAYSAGVAGGYAADALAQIQRRYFKRFPIDLPHNEEPPAEVLASIDDDAAAPEPEIEEPDPKRLTVEEFAAALEMIEARKKLLRFRKGQIKRWMAYQYMKDNDLNPKDSGAYNPYHSLLSKLTGKEVTRPRCKTGINMWRKTHREDIETELKKRLGELKGKRDQLAAERDKIAREMFSKLDPEEQRGWKAMALSEHDELMKQYKKDLQLANTPSRTPEDRQRCIQGLVRFMQPILDMVCDCTGWSATLMAGGPEPAQHGQLNIMSIHSGTTSGDIKMNFGHAERERYKRYFVPIFGSFLQQCFSPEECRSRSLPTEEGYLPMSALEFDDSVTLSAYDPSVPLPPIGGTALSATTTQPRGISSEPIFKIITPPTFDPNANLPVPENIRIIRPNSSSASATPQDCVAQSVTTTTVELDSSLTSPAHAQPRSTSTLSRSSRPTVVSMVPTDSQPHSSSTIPSHFSGLSTTPSTAPTSARSLTDIQPHPPACSPALSQSPSRAPSRAPSQPPSPFRSPAPSQPPSRAPSRAPSQPSSPFRSPAHSQSPSRAPSRAPSPSLARYQSSTVEPTQAFAE